MSDQHRLRILISAYACEPHKGSESAVGWNVATEMAKLHDVWVLTRANNRAVIETELAVHPVPSLNFIYYDLPKWAMWWKKGGRGVQFYYYLWELLSERIARRAEQQVGFDVAHHVTVVRYWTPSNLRNVKAPLVWGPVGGGESTPAMLKKSFSMRNRAVESVRDLVRMLAEFDPLVRRTARKSDVALATTKETAKRLTNLKVKRVEVLSQLGMVVFPLVSQKPAYEGGPVRFVCIGKQLYWKGFDLAIEAFKKASLDNAELILIGEGPENKVLRVLAAESGMSERISFLGWMDQQALHGILSGCDVLVHPSFHDSGAFVCLEAMTLGKPVICLNLGGPAVQVTKETGVKITAETSLQVVFELASAMQKLSADLDLRLRMGGAGYKRVKEHFLWSKKAEYFSKLYFEVVQRTASLEPNI
jgi:glycosyltransferase involved in cell wall biosynthesis